MPFERPTLTQRRNEALQDIVASQIMDTATGLVVDATMLQTSPLRVLAYAIAAAAYAEDGYIDWLALQIVPWTASGEWAVAWGAVVGITRKPAAAASGSLPASGPPGSTIAAGTQFSRLDGTVYAATATVAIGATGTATLAVQALVAGAAGNLAAGAALTPTLTLPGITVQPAGVLTGGAEAETDAAFRARYLQRFASPPQGGAALDYVAWLLAVPGVTRAWANPLGAGAGTVVIYTMWDGETANNGFPQGINGVASLESRDTSATGDQLTAADAIYPLRPATALVYSCAPVPYGVAFTLTTVAAVSDAIKAAAAAALQAVFMVRADPLSGIMLLDPFTAALDAVPGLPDYSLAGPGAFIQAPLSYLPVLGVLTWSVLG